MVDVCIIDEQNRWGKITYSIVVVVGKVEYKKRCPMKKSRM